MLYFMIMMTIITLEVNPPENPRWWHILQYLVIWPEKFGQWLNESFSK